MTKRIPLIAGLLAGACECAWLLCCVTFSHPSWARLIVLAIVGDVVIAPVFIITGIRQMKGGDKRNG